MSEVPDFYLPAFVPQRETEFSQYLVIPFAYFSADKLNFVRFAEGMYDFRTQEGTNVPRHETTLSLQSNLTRNLGVETLVMELRTRFPVPMRGSSESFFWLDTINPRETSLFQRVYYDRHGILQTDKSLFHGDPRLEAAAAHAGHFRFEELPLALDVKLTEDAFMSKFEGSNLNFRQPLLVPRHT